MDELFVNVNHESSGVLARSQTPDLGKYYFNYNNDSSTPIAIGMPLKLKNEGYYWEQGLHPIFDMNLPEGALRQALTLRFSKAIARFDDFDLLSIVAGRQLGRVNLETENQDCEGLSFSELKHYDGSDLLLAHLVESYATQSGISGVQPKFLTRNLDEQQNSLDHYAHKNTTHIIKGWGSDYPELALNEFLCLSVADKLDLKIPELEISDNGQFLFVSRFDINENEHNQFLGFEDFCAISGLQSQNKYDGTLEGCTTLIKHYIDSSEVNSSLATFFKSLILSVGLQNGDAHLKNFGFLYSDPEDLTSCRLAPCFDVVSTTVYIPDDSMALLFSGSKRWPSKNKLRDFAVKHCNLSVHKANTIIEQVADIINDFHSRLPSFLGQRKEADRLIKKMSSVWNNGLSCIGYNKAKIVVDLDVEAEPS